MSAVRRGSQTAARSTVTLPLAVTPGISFVVGMTMAAMRLAYAPALRIACPLADAFAALSPSSFRHSHVLTHKLMAPHTMSLAFVFGAPALTSKYIFLKRNWLKVIGVYACAIAAKMVKMQAFVNRSTRAFVGIPMSWHFFAVAGNKPSIAFMQRSYPNPTGLGLFDLLPKSNLGRDVSFRHEPSHSLRSGFCKLNRWAL